MSPFLSLNCILFPIAEVEKSNSVTNFPVFGFVSWGILPLFAFNRNFRNDSLMKNNVIFCPMHVFVLTGILAS
jgi:hypothetical protein